MTDLKQEYDKVLASGMFWEFHPDLTGDWDKDKLHFKLFKSKNMSDNQNVFPERRIIDPIEYARKKAIEDSYIPKGMRENNNEPSKHLTKDDYDNFAVLFFNKCLEIGRKKNADYTGTSQDPFANFKSVESLGIPTEIGFLTRMMDKISRIASFVNNGELQVKDESVQDSLTDLSNYACLMAGYIESKKK